MVSTTAITNVAMDKPTAYFADLYLHETMPHTRAASAGRNTTYSAGIPSIVSASGEVDWKASVAPEISASASAAFAMILIRASVAQRIIRSAASGLHAPAYVTRESLQSTRGFSPGPAYGRSSAAAKS